MNSQPKSMIKHFAKCFVSSHSSLESVIESGIVNAEVTRPLSNTFSRAEISYKLRAARVIGLLLWSCPSTIARAITAVIVDALHSVQRRWSWANVGIEMFKRYCPAFAYCYAAYAISVIATVKRIVATLEHAGPYSVFLALRHSMSCIGPHNINSRPASAGTGFPAIKSACFYDRCIAAFTATMPLTAPTYSYPFSWGLFNYREKTETLSDENSTRPLSHAKNHNTLNVSR